MCVWALCVVFMLIGHMTLAIIKALDLHSIALFSTDASTGKLCVPTEARHKHNPVNTNIGLYTGIFKV